jgi:hypothetical protein
MIKMTSWNCPFILSIIIGFVAVGLFYFDQKQKKAETNSVSYAKVFSLVTGSILIFNYFVVNESSASCISGSSINKQLVGGSVQPVNNVGLFSNLKIKEGLPDF